MSQAPWTREEFERKLREKEKYYHVNHEFHILMNSGKLGKKAIQGWVANRFYYQVAIPVKDAGIMANCWDRDVRREWIKRIIDHDGAQGDEGGIEAWLLLGEAVGLTREELWSQERLLPGVKFAVDAYVNFTRHQPWQVAAGSSLTELFAPAIHQARLDSWPQHYPWIEEKGYSYFRKRLAEAVGINECALGDLDENTGGLLVEHSRGVGLSDRLAVLAQGVEVLRQLLFDCRNELGCALPALCL